MATNHEFDRLRRQCSSGLRCLREAAGQAEGELENLYLPTSGKARAAVLATLQQTVQAGQTHPGCLPAYGAIAPASRGTQSKKP
jgi:hypothetical protein